MTREASQSTIPGLDPGIPRREGSEHSAVARSDRGAGGLTIAVETPLQDDVRALVAELNEALIARTPREFCHHLTVEQMADPSTTVFVARDEAGSAIAIGALRRDRDGIGEVKRMYTRPALQGRGIGGAMLERIEATARRDGLTRLVLETGEDAGFEAAWRIYERGGFSRCGPVLDYPDSGHSRFYEKHLTA